MMKIAYINKERQQTEAELSDFLKKLRERQKQRAYKMLMQEGLKKNKKSNTN